MLPHSFFQDMNEPASFVQGSVEGCPDSQLENPPFTPRKCSQVSMSFGVCLFFTKSPITRMKHAKNNNFPSQKTILSFKQAWSAAA